MYERILKLSDNRIFGLSSCPLQFPLGLIMPKQLHGQWSHHVSGRVVVSWLMCADHETCPTFWTAGQRAKLDHPAVSFVPLVWKLRPYVWQTMYQYRGNWPMTGRSISGQCVHVVSIGHHVTMTGVGGTWETSTCSSLRCFICELPLDHSHDH